MNGPADVMIQTEGNHEMDTKLGTGYLTVLGIDGRSSRLYHIEWLASTRIPDGKAEVFTEKIDMSVTE
jgi:hypothetical protein